MLLFLLYNHYHIYLLVLQAAENSFYKPGWSMEHLAHMLTADITADLKYSTSDIRYRLIIFLQHNSELCFAAIFYPSLIRNLFL